MKHLVVILFVTLFLVPSFAQEEFVNNNCPYATAEFHVNNVIIRYEVSSRRLIMVNLSDGSVNRVIEENVDMLHFGVFSWSPNCRYMVGFLEAAMDRDGRELPAALWDMVSGVRLQSIQTWQMHIPVGYGLQVLWKPDSSQAVIDTDVFGASILLWHSSNNQLLPINGTGYYFAPDMLNAYWDEGRNQLYLSGYMCVAAVDLASLRVNACYRSRPEESRYLDMATTFYLSPDKTRIVVFTNAAPRESYGYPASLTVWNLDTGESLEVNLGGYSANAQQVALSPDNRYLVLANRSLLRVWDIQNLPEAFEERTAIYTHNGPEGLISRIYFVEDGIIETSSEDGIQRWDIHTGAYIPVN